MRNSITALLGSLVFLSNCLYVYGADEIPISLAETHINPLISCFNHDGTKLLVGNGPGAWLFDIETGKLLRNFEHGPGILNSISFSPDSKWIVTGSGSEVVTNVPANSNVRIWEVDSGKEYRHFTRHIQKVELVQFNKNGRNVLSQGRDRKAIVWDFRNESNSDPVLHSFPKAFGASFSPSGSQVATWGHGLNIWDSKSGELKGTLTTAKPNGFFTHACFGSSDESLLTIEGETNNVILWNLQTFKEQSKLKHMAEVKTAFFSKDGKLIVTADSRNTVRLWKAGTTEPEMVLAHAKASYMDCLTLSPDGSRLFSSWSIPHGNSIRDGALWDSKTGAKIMEWKSGHMGIFSPDGVSLLVQISGVRQPHSNSYGMTTMLVDAVTGATTRRIEN